MDILIAQNGLAQQGVGIFQFLPFILIFAVIYFLMIRPQVKQQKKKQVMLDNLSKGDQVVTSGGIYGTISGFKENNKIIILTVDKNVSIRVSRSAVSGLVDKNHKAKK